MQRKCWRPQRSKNFIILVADGTVKIFGWQQRQRPTLTRDGQGDGVSKAGPEQAAADSWESLTFVCKHPLISLADGKHRMKGDLENHSRDQWFLLEQWLITTPISSKDQSRLLQLVKTRVYGIFLGCALLVAANLEKRYFRRRHWGVGKRWTHRKIHARRLNVKELFC